LSIPAQAIRADAARPGKVNDTMKTNIALVSVNPTVGALVANADRILSAYVDAAAQGADVVLTPEMSLTGYPLQDLTQRPGFLADVAAMRERLCQAVRDSGHKAALVFGHPTDTGHHDGNRRLVRNSATFYDPETGRAQVAHKVELPNYGVFDEKRNYLEGPNPRVVEWRGLRLGLMICEDGWFPGVARSLSAQGADALLWVNGSPFAAGKNAKRRWHASNRVRDAGVPIAYVNLVGGQDELVFDGDCFAWDGSSYVETPLFRETTQIVSFDVQRGQACRSGKRVGDLPEVASTGIADVYDALVAGLRGYVGKSFFDRVVEGYSGGVDSGLVAALGADAFGPENMLLVRLPSKYSSEGSLEDAAAGARALGCPMRTIEIEPVVEALRLAYATQRFDTGDAPMSPVLTGVADENIQARARGAILMAISNQEGHMLLNTTNKSEAEVGYGTLYGDLSGGYAVIKDVPKTMVWALCRHRNSLTADDLAARGLKGPQAVVVPEEIIAKPPSAELRPDQQDTDSLPPYTVLDPLLARLVDGEQSAAEATADGLADETVALEMERKVFIAEYKRRQSAPGIKIGDGLLGSDRRYPIINGYRSGMRAAIDAWSPSIRHGEKEPG
jgi:NAD+ synthase